MRHKHEHSSCELPETRRKTKVNQNRHYRFLDNFRWTGVKVCEYKKGGNNWDNIARQTLIGAGNESTAFHLRYFEIAPDGYSSFEKHKHEHVVIGVRGKGKARINRRNIELNVMDVLYIKPDEPHRLFNPFNEPFGFFCIVNAKRDLPVPADKTFSRNNPN